MSVATFIFDLNAISEM